MITDLNLSIAILTARVIVGILFFFQGYDKVFNVGLLEVKNTMKASLNIRKVPDAFIGFVATFSSWIEFICGLLLIVGLLKYFAIYLLCVNLMIIVFGFSISKPMWESGHVFIRLALLLLLLLTPVEWDRFSFDYLFALSKLYS